MRQFKSHTLFFLLLLGVSIIIPVTSAYGQFTIINKTPGAHSTNVTGSSPIQIEFSQGLDTTTFEDGIIIQSSLSGRIIADYELTESNIVSISPTNGFTPGEKISVTVTSELLSTSGISIDETQQWYFTVRPELGSDSFLERDFQLSDGSEPSAIHSVDLNNNLLPDLIVINSNNSDVTILENQLHITGDFLVRQPIETGAEEAANKDQSPQEMSLMATLPPNSSIATADLNGNGFSDIIIAATLSNKLILLQNSADGQINFNIELIETGERPIDVEVADIDNDGYQDLVVAAAGTDRVFVHFNNGDGSFSAPETYNVGAVPLSIKTDDLDNNGFIDVIIALSGEDRVVGLINDAAGSFTNATLIDQLSFTPTFLLTENIITGQSSDEYVDIILGSSDETEIYLYENNSGSFSFSSTLSSGQLSRPLSGLTSDINGDGILDLINSHFLSNSLSVNLNSESGFISQTVVDEIPGPVSIATSDYSSGGSMDLAVVNQTTEQVTLLYNTDTRPSPIISDDLFFGDVCIGQSATEILTVENVGSYPVVATVSIDDAAFTADPQTFEIGAQSSFQLPVTFTPDDRGPFNAVITLEYVRKGGVFRNELEYELSGRGVESGLELPNSLAFGELQVGASENRSIEIVNTGNIDTEIDLEIIGQSGIFSVQNPVSFTLSPSSSANAVITFTPEAFQDYADQFLVTATTFCDTLEYIIDLTGSGVDPITDLKVPDEIDFGDVEVDLTATENVVIQNSGNVSVNVDLLIEDDTESAFTISGPLSFTLSPDSIRNVPLNFSPSRTGIHTMTLQIDGTSDFGDVQYSVPVRGIGIEPLPDLEAVQILEESISGDYLLGQTYQFNATFKLERDADVTTGFDLQFRVNGEEQERIRFNESISPSDTRSFTFEHTFTTVGNNTIQFVVDSENDVREFDEENNSVSTTIVIRRGDLVISPNPFTPNNDGYNDQVKFDFTRLGVTSNPTIRIFRFDGRLIQTLQSLNGGLINWDGRDIDGDRLTPGVYLYVIEADNQMLGRGSITLAL